MAMMKVRRLQIATAKLDEQYVQQILDTTPKGLTQWSFYLSTVDDRNAGYGVEVDEAERRYFGRSNKPAR